MASIQLMIILAKHERLSGLTPSALSKEAPEGQLMILLAKHERLSGLTSSALSKEEPEGQTPSDQFGAIIEATVCLCRLIA